MRSKMFLALGLILLMALGLSGCNIFGWSSGTSVESLIEDGRRHMQDGEYAEAEAKFAEAMDKDPNSSEARYYHAKAVVHGTGENILTLASAVDGGLGNGDNMPFTGDEWPVDRASRLYQAVNTAYADLKPIFEEETSGSIVKSDIDADLGVVAAIKGMLMFRDTDTNGVINTNDYPLDIVWEIEGADDGFAINNMRSFIAANAVSPLRDGPILAAASPIPLSLIGTVNFIIDNIVEIIALARDIINAITAEFGLDPEEVEDFLNEVIAVAQYYKIADGLDNDGNHGADEEIIDGIDNDFDGRIDEDSNGMWE
ncbi:MAG: hypothetical protein ABIE70_00640 [bacterium]